MTTAFTPTVYLKQGCPFCLKLRIFLLEAGLSDRVTLIEAPTPDEHQALADELTAKMGKASFPSAEIAPGEYLAESDALVAHFAEVASADPERLPTYRTYVDGVFPRLQQLYRENIDLKQRLA
jgi:glutathione S-transferase